jgi:hypothetical protein
MKNKPKSRFALAALATLGMLGAQVGRASPTPAPTAKVAPAQEHVAVRNGTDKRKIEEDVFGGYAKGLLLGLLRARQRGMPSDVWGRSPQCARMRRKNRMRSLGIAGSRI